jgi:hypothetical protein
MKMLDAVINRLKNKNRPELLEKLFSLLAFMRYPLNDRHMHEALNILGVIRFSNKYSYLEYSNEFQRQIFAFAKDSDLKPTISKKIAICLSGDTRSFSHCIPQLKRFLSGYEITFFCHGWQSDFEQEHMADLNNAYTLIEERPDFSTLERSSIKAFGFKDFGQGLKTPFLSPNIFPMWYGVKKAYESIKSHGFQPNDFDLICRCRYDNFFLGKLSQLDALPESNEIIIDPNYDGYGGFGDQFAIGQPKVMKKYFTLYDWLPHSFKQYAGDKRFFPEVIIKKYLVDDKKVNVKQLDFGLRLLRNDFIGLEGHKIPLRSHSVSKTRNKAVSDYIKNKFPELYNEID